MSQLTLTLMLAIPMVSKFSLDKLLPLLLILPLLAFWIWMFRDMLRNSNLPDTVKNSWTIAFIFLNVVAAIFYYVYEYRNRH